VLPRRPSCPLFARDLSALMMSRRGHKGRSVRRSVPSSPSGRRRRSSWGSSAVRSQSWRPGSVFGTADTPDPEERKNDEPVVPQLVGGATTHCVGSAAGRSAGQMFTKTGAGNISRPIRTRVAKIITIIGYIIAPGRGA
jgi:hypothetical protein